LYESDRSRRRRGGTRKRERVLRGAPTAAPPAPRSGSPRAPAPIGAGLRLLGLAALVLSLSCTPRDEASRRGAAGDAGLRGDALTEAVRARLADPDGLERARSIAELLQSTEPESLDDVLAGFRASSLDHGDVELALFAEWWAHFDPESAFHFSQRYWRMDHPRVASTIVRSWARRDPESAHTFGLVWQDLSGSPLFRDELVDALLVGWSESGEPGALEFAAEIPDMAARQRGLRTLARLRLARRGPQATLEWASEAPGLPDGVRRQLVQAAVSVTAQDAPRLAAEWIDRIGRERFEEAGLVGRTAGAWARTEPEAALAWTATLEAGWERRDAVRRAMTAWLEIDPSAAAEWLGRQPPATWLDPAHGVYIRRAVVSNDYHVDWQALLDGPELRSIQDADRRSATRTWLLQRWLIVDEAGARRWIAERPDLTDRLRRALEAVPGHLVQRVLARYGSRSRS
jgi:hypothetical protein